MLSEITAYAGTGILLVSLVTLFVMLVLGLAIVCRARREDLPKIVKGLATWFRKGRR